MRQYPQAEPPGPVTCAVYVFVVVLLLGGVVFILLKTGGFV